MNLFVIIFVCVVLAMLSVCCGAIFCKTDKYSDSPADNPILGVFGICLAIVLLGVTVHGFDTNLLVGFSFLSASVLPWLGYFMFYQHKIKKRSAI